MNERLSGISRWGRAVATLALVAGVTLGAGWGTDRWWPSGPMTMFAFAVDPNGQVHSLGVEADTIDGQRVVVPLGAGGIGLERAEIEGQAERLQREPKRLQGIAVAAARAFPDRPRYRQVHLVDTVQQLKDGERVGAPVRSVLATWVVVEPASPKDLS